MKKLAFLLMFPAAAWAAPDGYIEAGRDANATYYINPQSIREVNNLNAPGSKLVVWDEYDEITGGTGTSGFHRNAANCSYPGLSFMILIENGKEVYDNGFSFPVGSSGMQIWKNVCGYLKKAQVPNV